MRHVVCVVELRVERKLWLINKIGYIPQCHGIPATGTRRSLQEKSGCKTTNEVQFGLSFSAINKKIDPAMHVVACSATQLSYRPAY